MQPPRPVKPDGLDTPGLNWSRRNNGWVGYWVARRDLIERGYSLKSARQFPPATWKVWRDPMPDEWNVIASQCQRLQGEMLEWANEEKKGYDARAIYDGSLKSLIKVFREDPDSPYQELRFRTRYSYDSKLNTLDAAVGDARIEQTDFRVMKRWHKGFIKPKVEGGKPRIARGSSLMTMVGIVLSFGVLLRLPGCKEARETRSELEFPNSRRTRRAMTAAQCIAIRAEAHRRGFHSMALTQALQFELGGRQKDFIGERVPISEPGISDVTYRGTKWLHGMHASEISADLIWTHRLSKSIRGNSGVVDPDAGKIEQFDLKAYPMVMEEWHHAPKSGPIIINEHTGRPWDQKTFGDVWREIANAVGIPKNIQNRHSRHGAITEGRKSGASHEDMRIVAGHSRRATTEGYDVSDVETKNKVAHLRVKNRTQTA